MRLRSAPFLGLCVIACCAWLAARHLGETARHADRYMHALSDREKFSGAVLIARDGRSVFEGAYGFADAEQQVENSTATRFRIASISKSFTASLVLQLRDQGRLQLDQSVCVYVTACGAAWEGITLHHLLSHTSGIFNFTDDPTFHARKSLPTSQDAIVAEIREHPLLFEPGMEFRYSNTNYLLLALVIEAVTGKAYDAFLREQILAPLEMNDTGVAQGDALLRGEWAKGYGLADQYVPASHVDPSWGLGSGAMFSTVDDLRRWADAFDKAAHLSPESIRQMTTPVLRDYGYGWSLATTTTGKVMAHSGRIDGFVSCFASYPEIGLTVVVLANREIRTHMCTIASNLAAIAQGESDVKLERHAVDVDAASLSRLAGRYRFAADLIVDVEVSEGRIFARIDGQPGRWEMFPESEARFFFKDFEMDVEFVLDRGRVASMRVARPLKEDMTGKPLPP